VTQRIETAAGVFLCDDPIEVARATTLETKEPGTVAWLRSELQPGDVFYDVGANVGCYTLLAASIVGPDGHVYAFEPHVGNAAALLRNVAANGYQDRVSVLTCALHSGAGWFPFTYASLRVGVSGNQLGGPEAQEMKRATSLHEMASTLLQPDVIKIDVDGNELAILQGIGDVRPRSIQVETAPGHRVAIATLLEGLGYDLVGRHLTANGVASLAAGTDADAITDNTIFRRAA
jgi:FkbM family methyltransferase